MQGKIKTIQGDSVQKQAYKYIYLFSILEAFYKWLGVQHRYIKDAIKKQFFVVFSKINSAVLVLNQQLRNIYLSFGGDHASIFGLVVL